MTRAQRMAVIRAALKDAYNHDEPNKAFEPIVESFLTEEGQNHPDLRVARQLAYGIEHMKGHSNRLVEHHRTLARRNRRARRHLMRNITTLHNFLDLSTVQDTEDEINAILRLVCEFIHERAPKCTVEASLDEAEFKVSLRDKSKWGKKWSAIRFAEPSIKRDGPGQQVLRLSVACLYWPALNLKVPCWLSLETHANKEGGDHYDGAPTPYEVVDEFLTHLGRFSFQPRRVYMDRRFESDATRRAWVDYKSEKAKQGWTVDFQSPAIRRGGANESLPLAGTLRKEGHTRSYEKRRATVRQLVENGDKIARTPMTQRPSWRFTVFEHGDSDAPRITKGCYLTIINAQPDGMETSGDFQEHEDGTRSFGNWSTEKWMPSTAYQHFVGYHRRNSIERVIQDYRDRLDMIRSPDIRLRMLSIGLGFGLLALWGLFRLRTGLELGRFGQGDYTLTHFLADVQPELSMALAAILSAA